MKVLMIEPGKAPYEAELDGSLESMQEAVGGGIEGYYPYAEPVAIVCNDEGKINGLPLNRAIYNEDGEMIEIMAGTFFMAGLGEESFTDLPDYFMDQYKEQFKYHIVGSRQDAEECVNDAYLGAWNAIPPARPNPLLSYLVKIVRNISLKIYWRKEAAKRSSHYTIALEEIEACIAAPNTVEAEIEAKELARIIEAFLDTLTTENRVIFMRRYWFSDSYKDIAEFMGLSEKNISVRLTRIREKMKQYLIEREVFV